MMKILPTILFVILILQACSSFTIKSSEKRPAITSGVQLSSDVTLTSTGAINIFKTDFLPSSFRIETEDTVIYIDPVAIDLVRPADYIFLTHHHSDHFSVSDIEKITNDKTRIFGPAKVVRKLSTFNITLVAPGDSLDLGDVKCEVVAAYNTKTGFLGIKAHPKQKENVGYIVTVKGVSVYHAGDTDYVPEMQSIRNITAALVPIDGGKLTMETDEAAAAVNHISPSIVIPMHYEIGQGQAEKFKSLVHDSIRVEILE